MANASYDPNMDAEKAQGGNVGIVKETPFSRLGGAVERLRKAHAHVVGVAGKLCGENPPEATTTGQRVSGSGMFGGIEELADSIIDMAGEIIDHAERINRRI